MDDLIYSFLLQSDYPRASVVFDLDTLGPSARPGPGLTAPSFIIVDPETAQILSVIQVVDAINGDALRQIAIETGAYASGLGNKAIQGFVVRVDVQGKIEAEQVQFYRVWPNSTLQQLNSKTFPDLDCLRVARKLFDARNIKPAEVDPEIVDLLEDSYDTHTPPSMGMFVPAFVLILLAVIDILFSILKDVPLLSASQSVLVFGAALLLTLPAAIRYMQQ